MPVADTILKNIILASQRTPFRARGGYSSIDVSKQKTASDLDKAKVEAADHERFYRYFPHHDIKGALQGATVLDFGSGYGGRTVEYARAGAAEVYGCEPVASHVNAGRALASEQGLKNVQFDICGDFDIPYDDNKFDVVITFDVLEHVADPRRSLAELNRVLKPSGVLFAVFPPYRGMFSHHLDYLTLAPGLHLMFKPQTIMRVVNRLLDSRFQQIEVPRHKVSRSYQGDRDVLPMLNGMGLEDFKSNAETLFNFDSLDTVSVARHLVGNSSLTARLMEPLIKMPSAISEVFIFHICAVMRPKK